MRALVAGCWLVACGDDEREDASRRRRRFSIVFGAYVILAHHDDVTPAGDGRTRPKKFD